ncbi:MAG: hypothetical protein OK439_00140 [Thaumarchaeota archaeon]|nr:hypothetical protein [Nitrososphaerota archaeon]
MTFRKIQTCHSPSTTKRLSEAIGWIACGTSQSGRLVSSPGALLEASVAAGLGGEDLANAGVFAQVKNSTYPIGTMAIAPGFAYAASGPPSLTRLDKIATNAMDEGTTATIGMHYTSGHKFWNANTFTYGPSHSVTITERTTIQLDSMEDGRLGIDRTGVRIIGSHFRNSYEIKTCRKENIRNHRTGISIVSLVRTGAFTLVRYSESSAEY